MVAWLLRRPVFSRPSPGLAAKVIPNEPGSAKPHLSGSKQAETVKDFTFIFFSIIFRSFFPSTQAPEAEKVPTQYAGLTSSLGYML